MRAEVVGVAMDGEDWDAPIGAVIEVIGFAMSGGTLWAIWRDDDGYVKQIPAGFIRMLPYVEVTSLGGSLTFGSGRLADAVYTHPSAEQAGRTIDPQPPDWRPRA